MERIKSRKNIDHILHGGYRHRKDRLLADGATSWRCPKRTCSGRLKISQDAVVSMVTEHNHAPNPNEDTAMKIVSKMRQQALTTSEAPRQIIQQMTAGVSLELACYLPEYRSSQRMIERQRKKHNVSYAAVNSIGDIDIPNSLKKTLRDEEFLLWDSGADDPKRVLMFGTSSNIDILQEHDHWFIDGTFKVAPTVFLQVFTIHALIDGSALPLIYILLPDKSEDSYARIFWKLKELKPTLNPSSIMADFEKASQNACSIVFPGAEMVGCYFHLGQNLWRKIQKCNLTTEYSEDENIRIHLKMILALSFVPVADVPMAFEDLVDDCPPQLKPVIDYWEDNYIGRQRRGRRANPKFSIQIWNMRSRVASHLPRTNNSVEAWHRAFQQTCNHVHPTVYKLCEQFLTEQDHTELIIERFKSGFRHPNSSKAKYAKINRRLEAIIPTYNVDNKLDFLRRIASNIEI